jgi:uncharacterized protein
MSGPDVHCLEDPFAFAQSGGVRSGQISIAAMRRLHDRLASDAGTVSYQVRGALDQRQRLLLELEVTGKPGLCCDRCLAPMDFALNLQSRVLLAKPGAIPAEDDDPESPAWTEAGQELDLLAVVEDEILRGLPLSVRHSEGNCNSGVGRMTQRDAPFAGLAALLGSKQTNTN